MQKRITKDLLTYLPGQALPALAAFITVPIYTRLFLPNEYGDLALAVTLTEFLLLGTTTGFGQAAVRFFSAYQLKSGLSNYFATVFRSLGLITLVVMTICTGVLLLIRPLISTELYSLLWAAITLFVVSAWFATLADVLRGQEQSRWYTLFTLIQAFGGIIFGLIFVLIFKMGIEGLIWGQVLGLFIPIPPLIWMTTRSVVVSLGHFDKASFKQLWLFALPFTIGNLAYWTLSSSDRYIIDFFRGSYEVGLYAVANKISWRSVQLLVHLFFLVPAPIVSRLWEERGRSETEEALTAFTRIFFLMIFPAVAGISVVGASLVRLLADEAYFSGYSAIGLVACASMMQGLANLGSTGSMVTNHTKLIARNQCIAAVAGLILNFTLVPKYGFMGAALSALIAFTLLAVLQPISSARFITWRWPFNSFWKVLVATGVMYGSVLLLQKNLRSDTMLWLVISLVLSITVGVVIYGLVLWVLGEATPRQLLGSFRGGKRQPTIGSMTGERGQK